MLVCVVVGLLSSAQVVDGAHAQTCALHSSLGVIAEQARKVRLERMANDVISRRIEHLEKRSQELKQEMLDGRLLLQVRATKLHAVEEAGE